MSTELTKLKAGKQRITTGGSKDFTPPKELKDLVDASYAKSEKLEKSIIEEHFGVKVRA